MKVMKLDKRYRLAQQGYVHALKFNQKDPLSSNLKKRLYKLYGWQWTIWDPSECKSKVSPWASYYSRDRKYLYIAFKHESDLTAAVLMSNLPS